MRLLFLPLLLVSFLSSEAQQQKNSADFERGYYYFYYQKWDSAYFYFDRFLQTAKDPVERAKTYSYIGELQQNMGDLYGAQESLMNALKALDPKVDSQHEQLAVSYNVLGNISLDLKQYDEAISFYNQGLGFQAPGSDFGAELVNGKTIALQRKGDYATAIALYDSILTRPQLFHVRLARLIHNRARTKWLQDKNYNPLPEYHRAKQMRLDSNFTRGLIASYAHLADYYEQSSPDSARWYARKMLEAAQQNQSAEDQLEAIDKLVKLSPDANARLGLYNEFRRLDDSLGTARDTTRNRFALVRYGVEKNKAEKLELEQRLTLQKIGMYALIAVAALIITALFMWYQRRRKKMQQESENAIKDARMKTSQKVHDVVANGLYGIMNELEHKQVIEREPLIERIEGLYEKSRNISYEDMASPKIAHHEVAIGQMLSSFSSADTRVITVGNNSAFWEKLSAHQQQQLELVLNELMVNMKKHSGAKNVVIQFAQEAGRARIHYKDDGVGLPENYVAGNGLKNTVNRISDMRGELIFGKSEKGGLAIDISLPLAHPTT